MRLEWEHLGLAPLVVQRSAEHLVDHVSIEFSCTYSKVIVSSMEMAVRSRHNRVVNIPYLLGLDAIPPVWIWRYKRSIVSQTYETTKDPRGLNRFTVSQESHETTKGPGIE